MKTPFHWQLGEKDQLVIETKSGDLVVTWEDDKPRWKNDTGAITDIAIKKDVRCSVEVRAKDRAAFVLHPFTHPNL